jgi:RNA polymerase sigma-70 factor (ECF subfamily)
LGEAGNEPFERLVLPHMHAAYTLALWLTRNEAQAEEAVQEAFLRAFRFFAAFRGTDARPWLLGIVRNVCYSWLERERTGGELDEFDEQHHGQEALAAGVVVNFPANPETALIEKVEREAIHVCLKALAPQYREVIVLREIHDCSYKEIAAIAAIPMGTVMSRLARGRRLLHQLLSARMKEKDTGT